MGRVLTIIGQKENVDVAVGLVHQKLALAMQHEGEKERNKQRKKELIKCVGNNFAPANYYADYPKQK